MNEEMTENQRSFIRMMMSKAFVATERAAQQARTDRARAIAEAQHAFWARCQANEDGRIA
ncbi:MAG TPA: hypothetical protein VFT66_15575 [Roseiflexaceae bacterium]|nr:hypothetical protein [Roseiflexaceae bacterium]